MAPKRYYPVCDICEGRRFQRTSLPPPVEEPIKASQFFTEHPTPRIANYESWQAQCQQCMALYTYTVEKRV